MTKESSFQIRNKFTGSVTIKFTKINEQIAQISGHLLWQTQDDILSHFPSPPLGWASDWKWETQHNPTQSYGSSYQLKLPQSEQRSKVQFYIDAGWLRPLMDCDNLHNIKRCMAPGKKKHQPTGVLNTARVYSLVHVQPQKLGFQSYLVSVRFRHFLFERYVYVQYIMIILVCQVVMQLKGIW